MASVKGCAVGSVLAVPSTSATTPTALAPRSSSNSASADGSKEASSSSCGPSSFASSFPSSFASSLLPFPSFARALARARARLARRFEWKALQTCNHSFTSNTGYITQFRGFHCQTYAKEKAMRIAFASISRISRLRESSNRSDLLSSSCTAYVQAPPSSLTLCWVRVRRSPSGETPVSFVGSVFTEKPCNATALSVNDRANLKKLLAGGFTRIIAPRPTTRSDPPSGPGSLQP
mmetsp:Transcript_13709/g.32240  ORF Transcript_13709/g.32240 Transcript_13709/m.32240 type:complete len:234 (-) Transcript_13709:716-1417(-)